MSDDNEGEWEECPRCLGRGCITETSIACLGCCPDCDGWGETYKPTDAEHPQR